MWSLKNIAPVVPPLTPSRLLPPPPPPPPPLLLLLLLLLLRVQESVLGGPQFFNTAVKALVEGMPGSGECENYIFTAMRGSGAYPMFKKEAKDSAAAAERAEEKMRGELEKTWWNGVPEADKVRRQRTGAGERRLGVGEESTGRDDAIDG